MEEPGRFGRLRPGQALLLSALLAVSGTFTVVLRTVLTNESLLVSLAISSGAFIAAIFMLVAWHIAKRRAARANVTPDVDVDVDPRKTF
ncbi:hypothetical protein GCM10027403_20750 [Arthrobacter tecti]